ncbi:MAG: hypothetical protein AAGJ35_15230 [Myxococcota bacterium]
MCECADIALFCCDTFKHAAAVFANPPGPVCAKGQEVPFLQECDCQKRQTEMVAFGLLPVFAFGFAFGLDLAARAAASCEEAAAA